MSAPADMRPHAGFRDLGSLALQPGGDAWAPDFSSDSEARSRDLVAGGSWDARSIVSSIRDESVLCVATLGNRAGAGVILARIVRAFADAGREVLLIDADVSRPLLAKPFQYQPDEGLVDMVLFGTSAGAAIRRTATDKIRVLTVGSPPVDAAEIWESNELAEILTAFRSEWNAVVVHAPFYQGADRVCAILRHVDALVLAMPASGVDPERIAMHAAALGATPRVLGTIRAGRESEVAAAPPAAPAAPAAAAPKPPLPPSATTTPKPTAASVPAPASAATPASAPAPSSAATPAPAATPTHAPPAASTPAPGDLGAKPPVSAPRTEPATSAPTPRPSEAPPAPRQEAEKGRPTAPAPTAAPPHSGQPQAGTFPRPSEAAQAGTPPRPSEPAPASTPRPSESSQASASRASEPSQAGTARPSEPSQAGSRAASGPIPDAPTRSSEPAPASTGSAQSAAPKTPPSAPPPAPVAAKPPVATPAQAASTPAAAAAPSVAKPPAQAPAPTAASAPAAKPPQPSTAVTASGAVTVKPVEVPPATSAPKSTPAASAPQAAPPSPAKPTPPDAKASPASPASAAPAPVSGRSVTAPEAAAEAARSTASAAPASPPPALETESEETLDDAPVRKSASLAKVLIVSAIIGVAAAGAAVMLTRLESNNRFADRSGVESGAGSRSAPSRPESPSGGSTVPQEMPAPVVPEPTDQAAGTATDSTIAGDAAQQPSGVAVQEGAPASPSTGAPAAPPAGTSSNATGTPPSNEAHVAQPGVIGDDAASSAIAGSTPETAPKQVAPAQRADDARTPSPADVAAGARASEAQPPDATSPRVSARSAAAATELWGVHVSSFPEQALATDDSLRWSRKQYPVTMVPKEIPDKGLWYRIVLGRFSSKAEAQSFAEDLRAREGLDYVLVMRIPTR